MISRIRRKTISNQISSMKRFVATAALLFTTLAGAQEPVGMIEWLYVGSEQAHTKYSAAEEITAANVGELEIVWQWEPNEMPLEEYGTRPGPFQATPIMTGNVLYLSTMYTRVVALDAETGAELWAFDPKAYEGGPKGVGQGASSTGVSPTGATTAATAFSSTAATGCTQSMPRPASWTPASARAGALC